MIDFASSVTSRSATPTFRCAIGLTALTLVIGCGGTSAAPARTAGGDKAAPTHEELLRRFEGYMARENGPFAQHEVHLLGGRFAGTIESATRPAVECEGTTCRVIADMGVDDEGDPNSIVCTVAPGLSPFGPQVGEAVDDARLAEAPILTTRQAGEGLAVSFVANAVTERDERVLVSTRKHATLYGRGFMATCQDLQAGGRETFDRVAFAFFDGLKTSDEAARHAVFSVGYQVRAGDRTVGFRFGFVSGRGDDTPGHHEVRTAFGLETEGRALKFGDALDVTVRDGAGAVESTSRSMWMNGKGPLRFSAKPAEGKKMRVKVESGASVNALELTPTAPANTEIWAAPDFLAVSTGRAPSFSYSVPSVHDHDPALRTVTLKRSAPGVLIETTGHADAKAGAKADEGEELHVDARGLVTKEIAASTVTEMLFSWGELPSARGRSRVATKPASGAARGAK